MSYASKMLSGMEGSLFNQIAMFSVAGLSTSMAMVIVGGFRVVHPWF
jgi:predicted exporter